MKKSLLLVFGLFCWVSFYGQNLVVGTQTSLSTAPFYSGYGAASFGDIKGIGTLDIVGEISNPSYQYLGVARDLTGTPLFTAQTHMTMETGNFYTSALGDLDGDGDLDLATGGPNGVSTSPNNVYFWNSSNDRYEKTGSAYSLASIAFYGWNVVVGNFTADTKKDVIWFSTQYMFLGTNSTTTPDNITFSSITQLGNAIKPASLGNSAAATADINNDGNLDIVTTDQTEGGSYQVILGNGNGTFTNSSPSSSSDGFTGSSVATGDLNKDGKSDFVITRSKYSPFAFKLISYTRNAENTGFDSTTIYRSNSEYGRPVVICDLNNDTWPDIELLGSSNAYAFLNKGDGTFNAVPSLKVSVNKNEFYVYDVDGNDFKDLVTVSSNSISYFPIIGVSPNQGGIIAGDETICGGTEPGIIASTNGASGHTGTLEYKWQMSTTNSITNFSDIAASNSDAYQPGNLAVTTWYKRLARLSGETTWDNAVASNVIEKTVNEAPEASTAVDITTTYDGSLKTASARPPDGSEINWYEDADGITVGSTPSAVSAGTYAAYAASVDNLTSCESTTRTLVQLVIEKAGLSVSDVTAENKVYDGNTSSTLVGGTLAGIVSPDEVTLVTGSGTFDDKNAGIAITITATGYSIEGADAANYSLIEQPSGLSADITPAELTASADNKTKTYGEVNPEFTITYLGFVLGETEDVIDVKPVAASVADISSQAGDYEIIAEGGSDNNYAFSYVSGTLTINETTGIGETSINGYTIYPNPARDILFIKSIHSTITDVKVFDMMGHFILNCKVENGRIDIHELPVGLYNLKIGDHMFKLVKK
jgi:hypothetical protein